MREWKTDRRREPGRQAAPSLPRRSSNPVLALQRAIGNRAVVQMIARDPDPVRTGTVRVAGVGKIAIKVKGGNLEEWDGTDVLYTVEVTSETGRHSEKLKKLWKARDRTDVTVMIDPPHKAGEDLNVGGGTELVIKDARIKGYVVEDGVEKWRVGDFEKVARKKITRKIGAGE